MLDDLPALRGALAGWYHAGRRQLPWREDPRPYRVWVAEVMLQQTQVATVIGYFDRFVARFPDLANLAAAPEEDVLALWSGLGYYRRARHLHAAARIVAARYDGALPETAAELRALPGIGRYTAGAIASIAFGQAEPVLDGNVARVLSRLLALEQRVDEADGRRRLWDVATELLDRADPSAHNQALMELGALACSPRSPACDACPLTPWCRAASAGEPERYPLKGPRAKPRPVRAVGGVARRADGAVLLARRPADVLLGGLWELPGADLANGAAPAEQLAAAWAERLGVQAHVGARLARVEHQFTHRSLTLDVHTLEVDGEPSRCRWYTAWRWVDPGGAGPLPLSRLTCKALEGVGVELG